MATFLFQMVFAIHFITTLTEVVNWEVSNMHYCECSKTSYWRSLEQVVRESGEKWKKLGLTQQNSGETALKIHFRTKCCFFPISFKNTIQFFELTMNTEIILKSLGQFILSGSNDKADLHELYSWYLYNKVVRKKKLKNFDHWELFSCHLMVMKLRTVIELRNASQKLNSKFL